MDKGRWILTAGLAALLAVSIAMAGPKVKRDGVSKVSIEEEKPAAATRAERESEGSTSSLDAAASLAPQSVSEEQSPATGASDEQVVPVDSPIEDPLVSDDLQSVRVASPAAASFVIPWQSINAGGGPSSSASYAVNASVGQSTIGQASSTNYGVGVGYWYGTTPGGGDCACDCPADPQCDGMTNIFDLVHAASVGMRNEPDMPDPNPLCPWMTTDVNCDGVTNIFDLVRLAAVGLRNEDPALHFCDPCAP